jgi:hypothetical protein
MKTQDAGQSKAGLKQHLKLLPVALLVLLLCSCSSNKPATAERKDSRTTSGSPGNATFSAVIDGTAVSGGIIGGLQLMNAAFSIPVDSGEPQVGFILNDSKTADSSRFKYSLKFQLPKKMGTITPANITIHMILDSGHSATYNSHEATVTVTSLTAARIAGVFSGKFKSSTDAPNLEKTQIELTDGKFDLPFSTSNVRPF